MHEIGTHVIDIQISENTTIIYSNDLKITWNQVAISLCALGLVSRLAQQFQTLPIIFLLLLISKTHWVNR